MAGSGDPLRERDANTASDDFDQFLGPDHIVGVADPPELFRVAEILRRDRVHAFAFGDAVLHDHLEAIQRRQEAAPHVDDPLAVGPLVCRALD
jgi:hypothetical protein